MKNIILTLIVLAVIGGGTAAYYMRKGVPEPTVTTMPLTRGDVAEVVSATGTLEAVETVDVGTQVSGVVEEMSVDFNDIVKKGQVIARLDPSIIQTQIEQAEANVLRAETDLDRLRVNLADAKRKFEQAKMLFDKQLIPRDQLETAELAVKTQESQIKSNEAGLVQVRSQLNTQRVNLGHTVIRAPITGIVISRNVDQGQTVAASMNAPILYKLAADLTKMQVVANIDEAEIGRMRPGQPVTFRVDAYMGELFTGTVYQVRLQPATVQNVVTYSTVIHVPNPDYKLKPGMTANVMIEIARKNNVLRAPAAALRFRPSNDVFAALKQEPPPEMARGGRAGGPGAGGLGGGAGAGEPGAGRGPRGDGPGAPATPSVTPPATPSATPPAQTPAASAPQGERRPEGQSEARPGGGDRTGDRPAGGGRGMGAMTEEQREAFRKQREERMKNMTPEEREAFEARAREGRGRGGAPRSDAPGDRPAGPPAAPLQGSRQGTGARDAQSSSRLAEATNVDALFAPLPPTQGRGRLWLFANKQLKAVNVRTGITDGTWTEIIETPETAELKPDVEVVTNVITGLETQPRAGQQNPGGSPLMPQRGRGPGGMPGGGGRGR